MNIEFDQIGDQIEIQKIRFFSLFPFQNISTNFCKRDKIGSIPAIIHGLLNICNSRNIKHPGNISSFKTENFQKIYDFD